MNSWPARKSLTGLDKMLATIFNMEPERGSWGGSTPTFHIPDAMHIYSLYYNVSVRIWIRLDQYVLAGSDLVFYHLKR